MVLFNVQIKRVVHWLQIALCFVMDLPLRAFNMLFKHHVKLNTVKPHVKCFSKKLKLTKYQKYVLIIKSDILTSNITSTLKFTVLLK